MSVKERAAPLAWCCPTARPEYGAQAVRDTQPATLHQSSVDPNGRDLCSSNEVVSRRDAQAGVRRPRGCLALGSTHLALGQLLALGGDLDHRTGLQTRQVDTNGLAGAHLDGTHDLSVHPDLDPGSLGGFLQALDLDQRLTELLGDTLARDLGLQLDHLRCLGWGDHWRIDHRRRHNRWRDDRWRNDRRNDHRRRGRTTLARLDHTVTVRVRRSGSLGARGGRRRLLGRLAVDLEDLGLRLDVFVVGPAVVELPEEGDLVVTVLDDRPCLDVEVLRLEVAIGVGRALIERTGGDPGGTVAALNVEGDVAIGAFVEPEKLQVEGADLGLVARSFLVRTQGVNLDCAVVAGGLCGRCCDGHCDRCEQSP